jgi:hypothetical protein
MVIVNKAYGRKDIKDQLKKKMDDNKVELKNEVGRVETKMDAGLKRLRRSS